MLVAFYKKIPQSLEILLNRAKGTSVQPHLWQTPFFCLYRLNLRAEEHGVG